MRGGKTGNSVQIQSGYSESATPIGALKLNQARESQFTHRSLRRMYITRCVEEGMDVKVIAEWQGHKDAGKLILDTYSHANRVHAQRMTSDEPPTVIPITMEAR